MVNQAPAIHSRVRPLQVRRGGCFRVAMRRMTPGPRHGQWEYVTKDGFLVVCPSYLEASNLVFMIGGWAHPRPRHLMKDDDHDEERYLRWLLDHHFRIEPMNGSEVGSFDSDGVCRRTKQVLYWTFIRGWYPDAKDLTGTPASNMVGPALMWKWRGR